MGVIGTIFCGADFESTMGTITVFATGSADFLLHFEVCFALTSNSLP